MERGSGETGGEDFMFYENLKIYIERAIWNDLFHVHIGARINESTKFCVAQPMLFKELTDAEQGVVRQPCFSMSQNDAQRFMDELWNAGLRPSEGTGSAGAMAAVQAHLKDMQRLVFTDKEQAK